MLPLNEIFETDETLESEPAPGIFIDRRRKRPGSDVTDNIFCKTGQGGGIDPSCSSKGGQPAAKDPLGFSPVVRVTVEKTLNELTTKYGVPRSEVHLVSHTGGELRGRAIDGIRVVVPKAEAMIAKAEGKKTYPADRKAENWIVVQKGNAISIASDIDKRRPANVVKTGRDPVEQTVVHEFGHVLHQRAGITGKDTARSLTPQELEVAKTLSPRARENYAEFLAEAFTAHHYGKGDYSQYLPFLPKTSSGVGPIVANIFCPTGQGGGIDPTCGAGKSGSGGAGGSGGQSGTPVEQTAAFNSHASKEPDRFSSQDMYLHDLFKENGYAGKPKQASKEEMDKLVAEGHMELHRGAPAAHHEQFKNGDLFVGKGAYSAGVYTATGPNAKDVAYGYASGTNGYMIRMVLDKDAKIGKYKKLDDEMEDARDSANQASIVAKNEKLNKIKEDLVEAAKSGDTQKVMKLNEEYLKASNRPSREMSLLYGEVSRYAAAKGYDAVYVEGMDYVVVLNRSKVTVQKEPALRDVDVEWERRRKQDEEEFGD